MDYFSVFDLEPKLSIDVEDLQARFYKLSRELHPDRFARASAQEQQQALETTSLLNDGLRILKDPVKRAEYMISRKGLETAEEKNDVSPAMLEEVFELNEKLDELRSGDASVRPEIESALRNFVNLRDGLDSELQGLFTEYDWTERVDVLKRVRRLLNRRRYFENLVNEASKTLKA
jgi:molecular chaperone HscB